MTRCEELGVCQSLTPPCAGICTWSEEWRNECEARYLMGFPLDDRRAMLEAREKQRGDVSLLKEKMVKIHKERAKT